MVYLKHGQFCESIFLTCFFLFVFIKFITYFYNLCYLTINIFKNFLSFLFACGFLLPLCTLCMCTLIFLCSLQNGTTLYILFPPGFRYLDIFSSVRSCFKLTPLTTTATIVIIINITSSLRFLRIKREKACNHTSTFI